MKAFNKTSLALVAFLALLAGAACAAPHPFGPGEKLTYALKVTGVKAGEFEMTLHENPSAGLPKAFLIEAHLYTTAPFKWMYPVEDRAQTVMSWEGLKPLSFKLSVLEGGHKKRQSADFTKTKVSAGTHDFLSLLYALRAAPLAVGYVAKVKVWSDKKVIDLPLRVHALKAMKSGVGKRECFLLSPINQMMIKDHPVEIEMAISNDTERLPVSLSAKASIATISAVLKEAVKGR